MKNNLKYFSVMAVSSSMLSLFMLLWASLSLSSLAWLPLSSLSSLNMGVEPPCSCFCHHYLYFATLELLPTLAGRLATEVFPSVSWQLFFKSMCHAYCIPTWCFSPFGYMLLFVGLRCWLLCFCCHCFLPPPPHTILHCCHLHHLSCCWVLEVPSYLMIGLWWSF